MPMDRLTEMVIGFAMRVSNGLGAGLLEKPYENALAHEMRKAGVAFAQQKPVAVIYDGVVVGDYVIDILVDDRLVLEIKACQGIDNAHVAQTINYLKATRHNVGLILNFGNPKLQVKRLVHNY